MFLCGPWSIHLPWRRLPRHTSHTVENTGDFWYTRVFHQTWCLKLCNVFALYTQPYSCHSMSVEWIIRAISRRSVSGKIYLREPPHLKENWVRSFEGNDHFLCPLHHSVSVEPVFVIGWRMLKVDISIFIFMPCLFRSLRLPDRWYSSSSKCWKRTGVSLHTFQIIYTVFKMWKGYFGCSWLGY